MVGVQDHGSSGVNVSGTGEHIDTWLTHPDSPSVLQFRFANGDTILADESDRELLLAYTWHVAKSGGGRPYAVARIRGAGPPYKRIKMHRLITNAPDDAIVHHINNDGLDNRRCNLEVTTNRQNLRYHYDALDGGVYFDRGSQKWRAQLRGNDGKQVYLGLFDDHAAAQEAARAFRSQRAVRDPYRYMLVDKFGMRRGSFPTVQEAADAAQRVWPDQQQDPDRTGAGWDVECV